MEKQKLIKSPITGKDCEERSEEMVIEYKGKTYKVTRRFYHDLNSGMDFTTTETDQEWYDELMSKYYKDMIPDLDVLGTIDPLVILKYEDRYLAWNDNHVPQEFHKDPGYYILYSEDIYGEGKNPGEAMKNLYLKLGK